MVCMTLDKQSDVTLMGFVKIKPKIESNLPHMIEVSELSTETFTTNSTRPSHH